MKDHSVIFTLFLTYIPAIIFIQATDTFVDYRPSKNQELTFFQQIEKLNFTWDDIVGSYKNVTAQVQTEQCKGICKTAIALYVLQQLKPCELIEKADCPKGLVCCSNKLKEDDLSINLKPNEVLEVDNDQETSDFVPVIDQSTETELYYPEPILDPIPDDESSEILRV